MTFTELKNKINNYNATHNNNRFGYNPETCSLLIGEYEVPFDFAPNDYKDALDFITKYGMLKEDKDCLGDELWYKGLKWNDLTLVQKDSIINSYNNHPNMTTPDNYAERFENNMSFLTF